MFNASHPTVAHAIYSAIRALFSRPTYMPSPYTIRRRFEAACWEMEDRPGRSRIWARLGERLAGRRRADEGVSSASPA